MSHPAPSCAVCQVHAKDAVLIDHGEFWLCQKHDADADRCLLGGNDQASMLLDAVRMSSVGDDDARVE